MTRTQRCAAVCAGVAASAGAACAQTALTTILAAGGLDSPVQVTHAPGDFARLFVAELPGTVSIVKNGQVLPTPFLNITGRVQSGGSEQGFFSVAFAPDYSVSGHFYVSYTGPFPAGDSMIERYRVSATNPDLADPGSAALVIRVPQEPYENHNGGWIGFGQDGYLRIALGDGGAGCDPFNNAQNPGSLLGKILRLNVSSLPYTIPPTNPFAAGGGRPEVWVMGLRNPWRCSEDRATGDLWIGDVGEDSAEEVNFLSASTLHKAANFGWNCREGLLCATASGCGVGHCPAGCSAVPFTNPIHTYAHSQGCSISGGHVYRGCAIPDLQGTYFFGDFCTGRVWSLRYNGTSVTNLVERTDELQPPGGKLNLITGFGEDAYGELYICDGGGEIYKIVPDQFVGPDCNTNARRDACDILSGYSTDGNANGVPDECDCYPNCNGSYNGQQPTLTVGDFTCFQAKFVSGHPYANCNQTGGLTVADFSCFQTKFVQGCP